MESSPNVWTYSWRCIATVLAPDTPDPADDFAAASPSQAGASAPHHVIV